MPKKNTTSEPLVPKGLPHGDRQKLEAAMEVAGLPKQPTEQDSSIPGGVPPSNATPTRPAGNLPPDLARFDVFDGREPTGQAPIAPQLDPVSLFQARLDTSENEAMRYYFGRFQEFLE